MAVAAAAYNVDEEQVWKCQKHPSKRRRSNGVCPACLRDRLASLCPHCAHARPCACASTTSSFSRSTSSSSNGEPSFRRSRSLAVPFLRSRNGDSTPETRTPSFLSILTRSNTRKRGETVKRKGDGLICDFSRENDENLDTNERIEEFARMITRSRSVSAAKSSPAPKRKFWHFPSPMKVFRSYKRHHQRKDIVV